MKSLFPKRDEIGVAISSTTTAPTDAARSNAEAEINIIAGFG